MNWLRSPQVLQTAARLHLNIPPLSFWGLPFIRLCSARTEPFFRFFAFPPTVVSAGLTDPTPSEVHSVFPAAPSAGSHYLSTVYAHYFGPPKAPPNLDFT